MAYQRFQCVIDLGYGTISPVQVLAKILQDGSHNMIIL